MHAYKFAVSYFDPAGGDIVGFVIVDAMAESAERASLEVEESKRDAKWLMTAFGVAQAEDIDGILVGEHIRIGHATTAAPASSSKQSNGVDATETKADDTSFPPRRTDVTDRNDALVRLKQGDCFAYDTRSYVDGDIL